MELIPKQMSSRHKLMVLLVTAVSFLAKNLTIFLTVESFIKGCMLIASTNNIVTFLYLILVLQVSLLGQIIGQWKHGSISFPSCITYF